MFKILKNQEPVNFGEVSLWGNYTVSLISTDQCRTIKDLNNDVFFIS